MFLAAVDGLEGGEADSAKSGVRYRGRALRLTGSCSFNGGNIVGAGRGLVAASWAAGLLAGAFRHRIFSMAGRYEIELEPEVQAWLDTLPDRHYLRVERYADLLAERAETLGEPWSRHLGGALRELRFGLETDDWRITYWLAPGRRIVLLTVFRKTRDREEAQVRRATAAQQACQERHGPAGGLLYERHVKITREELS